MLPFCEEKNSIEQTKRSRRVLGRLAPAGGGVMDPGLLLVTPATQGFVSSKGFHPPSTQSTRGFTHCTIPSTHYQPPSSLHAPPPSLHPPPSLLLLPFIYSSRSGFIRFIFVLSCVSNFSVVKPFLFVESVRVKLKPFYLMATIIVRKEQERKKKL